MALTAMNNPSASTLPNAMPSGDSIIAIFVQTM
jgi:hypothetical protein